MKYLILLFVIWIVPLPAMRLRSRDLSQHAATMSIKNISHEMFTTLKEEQKTALDFTIKKQNQESAALKESWWGQIDPGYYEDDHIHERFIISDQVYFYKMQAAKTYRHETK